VVLHARRKDRLDALAAEIGSLGGAALVVTGDAGKQADLTILWDRAMDWDEGGKKCDIALVNAGRGLAGGVLGSDPSQWQELIEINILGATYLMRLAGHHMAERKAGDIVVLGSVVGRNVSPFGAFYGASKFAITAMAEGLRREICPHGVRVSVVMPGIVKSEFQAVAGYNQENFGNVVEQFGTLLEPENIADAIFWLLSQPPYMNVNEIMIRPTGQNYP
jgi:NADP-dependent 3-hydroxy acid dehydrogenase YdfG